MGGERLEGYWAAEMRSLLELYRQFEILIPAINRGGAAHPGEDGRYIESILKEKLSKFLPAGVEVLTGFILRAGVKSGFSGGGRRTDEDKNSSQLDLIIYDTHNYPVYQRFGDTAVVPPEGVIGIISVKKTLRKNEINHEVQMLHDAAMLCALNDHKGPFLALVGMRDEIKAESIECSKIVFESVENVLSKDCTKSYDTIPNFIGNLAKWTIHKVHKKDKKCAELQLYVHNESEEHLGLQYLLKGILDVYYSNTNHHGKQPGYISFPKNKGYSGEKIEIKYDKEQASRT